MRWKQVAAVFAVGALVTAAACGGSPSENNNKQTSEKKSAEPQATGLIGKGMDANAKAPAPEVPGAKKGGTVTVYSDVAPATFDPTRQYYIDGTAISKLVLRTLTQYKYDPKTGGMILVPDLATDLGKPNKDFTKWTFTLRDGIKYEDGTPVTSKDIAYAIKRQFAIEELPDGPTYGNDFYLDGDKYKGPWKSGPDFRAVETPDDKTVVINMRKPFADMPYYASFHNFTPIPEDKDTKADYGNHPLATGPYKFEKYRPGKELTLVRNEHWDPKTDTVRHQYPDKWVFKFAQVEAKFHRQLIADKGADQYAMTYDSLNATDVPHVIGKAPESRVVKGRQNCVSYVYFDMRKITDKRVRKAIGLAWDIEGEVKAGGSIPGLTWEPATAILPKVDPGYKEFDVFGHGGKGNGDPEAARALLKEADAEGYELSWYYANDDEASNKVNQVRIAALKKAGFNPKPIGVATTEIRQARSKLDAPTNLRTGGWCEDWASGGSVFPAQWDGRKANLQGAPVPSYMNEEDVNKRMDEILQMPVDKAIPAWGELDKYIMEKYIPALPIAAGNVAFLHGSKVKNVHNDETFGQPFYPDIYVEQ